MKFRVLPAADGEAIAAAIAAAADVPVQAVPYQNLRARLVAHKQVLDLPDGGDPPSAPDRAPQ